MNKHEDKINSQNELHAAACDSEMCATIEHIGRKSADCQLDQKKGRIAKLDQLIHQAIAFACDVAPDPQQRELRIDPIQCEEKQAFCQRAHL